MRLLTSIFLLFSLLATTVGYANERTIEVLNAYLRTDTTVQTNVEDFSSFIRLLEKKKTAFKNEEDFLRFVFTKTHQKFLKQYRSVTSFGKILTKGEYNCLTGTALLAALLNHFNASFTIIETNYHIFILTKTNGKSILLEATDPLTGFIANEIEIEQRLDSYRSNVMQPSPTSKNEVKYTFSFSIWNSVTLEELTGLLYFNQSIEAYNKQKIDAAVFFLSKAIHYQTSARMEEFSQLIVTTIEASDLTSNSKSKLVAHIKMLKRHQSSVISASLMP